MSRAKNEEQYPREPLFTAFAVLDDKGYIQRKMQENLYALLFLCRSTVEAVKYALDGTFHV